MVVTANLTDGTEKTVECRYIVVNIDGVKYIISGAKSLFLLKDAPAPLIIKPETASSIILE